MSAQSAQVTSEDGPIRCRPTVELETGWPLREQERAQAERQRAVLACTRWLLQWLLERQAPRELQRALLVWKCWLLVGLAERHGRLAGHGAAFPRARAAAEAGVGARRVSSGAKLAQRRAWLVGERWLLRELAGRERHGAACPRARAAAETGGDAAATWRRGEAQQLRARDRIQARE